MYLRRAALSAKKGALTATGYNSQWGVNDWAHIAWFTLGLTTVLVYLAAIDSAVAKGFLLWFI